MMIVTCWSVKGGSGTTVVAASLALTVARVHDRATVLVDAAGEAPAVLGIDEPVGPGLSGWTDTVDASPTRVEVPVDDRLSVLPRGDRRTAHLDPATVDQLFACLRADDRIVIVDAGTIVPSDPQRGHDGLVTRADRSILVIRSCYLALRRAARTDLPVDGVVLVEEPGRVLAARDVASVVGAPVAARIRVEPQIARLVDAGLMCSRLPRSIDRALADVVGDAA